MAVDNNAAKPAASAVSTARRFAIGTNVVVAVLLVGGIVAVVQAIAYAVPARWDMTSSGVNSLSEGTENLLRNLDQNLRLTSLYFQTDLEEPDQQRYRRAVQDLLD
ncbi:MAG: Gldg family protein, partial [Phycisphaerae bacterium]